MLPTSPDAPGAEAGQRVLERCKELRPPDAHAVGRRRPVLTLETGRRFAAAIGRPEPEVIPDASHFLQEDQGELIGRRIADWLTRQVAAASVSSAGSRPGSECAARSS